MTVIARDAVASDHLVYAWPFPIGPECEVACSEDEQVVMCPAWMVGDRLGPGRHRWRTPDPTRPVGAFFVLTAPVEVSFDMITSFMIPTTGQPVRLRASGSLQVRCADPGLLIAQFVGLPFDNVNDGVLRSVSRSVERMLARLLTRRVVMSGTPVAVTEAGMLPGIIEELVAYNPTAGAVFGVEMIRMGHLVIAADDGSALYLPLPSRNLDWSGSHARIDGHTNGDNHHRETMRAVPAPMPAAAEAEPPPPRRHHSVPPGADDKQPPPLTVASGEINSARAKSKTEQGMASGEILPKPKRLTEQGVAPVPPQLPPLPRRAQPIEVPQSTDEITQPGVDQRLMTPVPGALQVPSAPAPAPAATPAPNPAQAEARGSILGIGMSAIGGSAVAGEIPTKVPPGGRVLVPGPNGLMQSATVRQLLQGYYELEVGSSGQTIWVPINGVVPES